jgi:hypothetical protein
VDQLDPANRSGWSVVVHGWAQEVTDYDSTELVGRVRSLALSPWAEFDNPHLVRVASHTMTGRRVAPQELVGR